MTEDKDFDSSNKKNKGENSTCPPIEIGMHQNSYKPNKNLEKRRDNNE